MKPTRREVALTPFEILIAAIENGELLPGDPQSLPE